MSKAKNKSTGKEVDFVTQKNETVIVNDSPKGHSVISKQDFEKLYEIIPDAVPEQPAQ